MYFLTEELLALCSSENIVANVKCVGKVTKIEKCSVINKMNEMYVKIGYWYKVEFCQIWLVDFWFLNAE
jgi:hypothetical protein